ncbi:MAG: RNA polymerase sigma factor [Candidatus Aminicenantales bacterium]
MDEDRELVERTLQGEREAFEMIIKKYQRPLLNYIGRMVGERELALEFTQEVFFKTYSSLPSYNPEYRFNTWLFKIASNYIIDYWRKKKVPTISLESQKKEGLKSYSLQLPSGEHSLEKKFELSQMRKKIEHALEKLPASLRELFLWRHVNELSYEEIAEIKELPVGTVKNRVFQAKEILRRLLADEA